METVTYEEKLDKHAQRMNLCAYECFENNPFGKELLENYKMSVMDLKDRSNHHNLSYLAGQEDLIRNFIIMVDKHKAKSLEG